MPRFARRLAELEPAVALAGNAADAESLRAVSAALLTAGDGMARAPEISPGDGVGLRGGRFNVTETATGYRLALHELLWTEDLAVTGTVEWPFRSGPAHAALTLRGADGLEGTVDAQWLEGVPLATVAIRGTLRGRAVVARFPAP